MAAKICVCFYVRTDVETDVQCADHANDIFSRLFPPDMPASATRSKRVSILYGLFTEILGLLPRSVSAFPLGILGAFGLGKNLVR